MRAAVAVLALLAMTIASYTPALRAGWIWDDDRYVTHNVLLQTWDGLRTFWTEPASMLQYYPLTHSLFWLQYQLWGLSPAGYHVTNVLLHALVATLVWAVLRLLGAPGAWLAAAIFAIHPVHVESVAWVSELKNVLSGLFYLAAGAAFLHARRSDGRAAMPAYVAAVALFVCALLSKTVTCTLPVALAIVVWWKDGRLSRHDVGLLAPLLLAGIAGGVATPWLERRYVGAAGPDWDLSLVERVLIAGRALWFYLRKLVLPVDLSFIYPRWQIDPGVWWQHLFPAAAAAAGLLLWLLRRRIGRGPLAAALYFAVTVGPALGFFDIFPMLYSFVADHFQYLASLGPIALGAALIARYLPGRLAHAGALGLLLCLGLLTHRQSRVYAGHESLWRDVLAKNERAWMAHNNLGLALVEQRRLDEAEVHFARTLELRPAYGPALYNLGNVRAAQGRMRDAIGWYDRALAVDPSFPPAHSNLATAYAHLGEYAPAIRHYQEALRLLPDFPDARRNLDVVLRLDVERRAREAAGPGQRPSPP